MEKFKHEYIISCMNLKCPICGKIIKDNDKGPDFPFCSERCRLIDLNAWLQGDYMICSPIPDEEDKKGDNAENILE